MPAPSHARAACGLTLLLAAATPAPAAPLQVQVGDAQGRPLPDAVVWVDSAAARAAARPLSGVAISQRQRQFQPAVSVVTTGSAVSFPNEDTVRHHVYSFSPVKKFEIKLYVGTPAAPVVFDKPGIAVLGCNIHDQMTAWVVVLESPWHARSGADGLATLADVPAGAHTLRVWHPGLPPGAPAAEQAISLGATAGRASLRLGVGG